MDGVLGFRCWPDLVLEITTRRKSRGSMRYGFRAVTRGARAPDLGFIDVAGVADLIEEILNTLNTWVDPELSQETESIRTHLDGLGLELFRSLVSPQMKDYYWQHLHGQRGLSVLLAVDKSASAIPWELVKPSEPERGEAPFWCEQFAIGRWVPAYPVAEVLPGIPVACVLADANLRDVSSPAEDALGVPETQLVETWQDLVALLRGPGLGLLHWTGHGTTNLDNSSFSILPIGGEFFRPLDLAKPENRQFAFTGPWVFLHACSSTHVRQVFQNLGDWPGELIEAGCGAVLGTAWNVRASAGRRFVSALYPALQRGLSIGEAVRQARIAAQQADDPSWLAYQLYGNPSSRIDPRIREAVWTRASIQDSVDAVLGPQAQRTANWRQAYLEWVVRHPLDASSPMITVEAVTTGSWPRVSPTALAGPVASAGPAEEWAEVQKFERVADALREYGSMVLLGPPGSGKTTALRVLLRELAEQGLNGHSENVDETSVIPVLIGMEDYTSAELPPLEYISRRCRSELKTHLEGELLAGHLCLLCDGLDEMPRFDYYRKVRNWRRLVETYEGSQFVFTCRTHNYNNELHLQPVEICAGDDEQILRFLTQELGSDASSCWQLLNKGHLIDLARIPLLLTWMVKYYISTHGAVPKSQGALLRDATDRLIIREREKATGGDINIDVARAVLAEIAYRVYADPRDTDLPVAVARAICTEKQSSSFSLTQASPDTVLSFVSAMGMLTKRQGRLRFLQRQFQEYFAACALIERFDAGTDLSGCWQSRSEYMQAMVDHRRDPWRVPAGLRTTPWDEPTVLAAGLLDDPNPLLTSIYRVNPLLAGRAAADVSALVQRPLAGLIAGELLSEAADPAVPLRKRIECGDVLGRLQDPRFVRARGLSGTIHAITEMVPVPWEAFT